MRRQLASASKAEQAREIRATLDRIARLHEASFQPASPHRARAAGVGDQEAILSSLVEQHLKGISLLNLRQRRRARREAAWAAYREIDQRFRSDRQRQATEQARFDNWWDQLRTNNRETVLRALRAAFADNEAAAAPLDVDGETAWLLVYLPSIAVLPERQPSVTEAGNLSLRKMTKAQAAAHYRRLVAGFLLVTAKEAFAVAPGLRDTAVLAIRDGSAEASDGYLLDCVAAARLSRAKMASLQFSGSDSVSVLTTAADDLRVNQRTAAQAWDPLRLDGEPEISNALRSFRPG